MSILRNILQETAGLSLISHGWSSDSPHVKVSINKKTYHYKPRGFSPKEFHDKIEAISKHSSGRALQWIKSHSDLVRKESTETCNYQRHVKWEYNKMSILSKILSESQVRGSVTHPDRNKDYVPMRDYLDDRKIVTRELAKHGFKRTSKRDHNDTAQYVSPEGHVVLHTWNRGSFLHNDPYKRHIAQVTDPRELDQAVRKHLKGE